MQQSNCETNTRALCSVTFYDCRFHCVCGHHCRRARIHKRSRLSSIAWLTYCCCADCTNICIYVCRVAVSRCTTTQSQHWRLNIQYAHIQNLPSDPWIPNLSISNCRKNKEVFFGPFHWFIENSLVRLQWHSLIINLIRALIKLLWCDYSHAMDAGYKFILSLCVVEMGLFSLLRRLQIQENSPNAQNNHFFNSFHFSCARTVSFYLKIHSQWKEV